MTTVKELSNQFHQELLNSGKEPIFEIPVINNEGEKEYILCMIQIHQDSIEATRDAVSSAEENSQYIAYNVIDIEEGFSLDEHLQTLYTVIIEDILEGDLYTLSD